MKYRMTIRIEGDTGIFFGPGPARLLQLVQTHHSLHKAAAEMKMAYSKAWRIIKDAEAATGFPILIRTRGGSDGGGSELTEDAEKLLAAYLQFAGEMKAQGDLLFPQHFAAWMDEEGDS